MLYKNNGENKMRKKIEKCQIEEMYEEMTMETEQSFKWNVKIFEQKTKSETTS